MTTVTVSLKALINTGNYNNIEIGTIVTDEVREEESASDAWDRVWRLVEHKVDSKAQEVRDGIA